MLKRLVQACFLIIGGTLGIFLLPALFKLFNLHDIIFLNNSYVTAILGAIIFYFITFWTVDYVVGFVKWFEDSVVRAPITEIISGSLGLIFGLLVAFLLGIPFNNMQIPIVSILLTLLLGYLGFQIGFKKLNFA